MYKLTSKIRSILLYIALVYIFIEAIGISGFFYLSLHNGSRVWPIKRNLMDVPLIINNLHDAFLANQIVSSNLSSNFHINKNTYIYYSSNDNNYLITDTELSSIQKRVFSNTFVGLGGLKEQNNIPVVVLNNDSIYHVFTGNDSIVINSLPHFKDLYNQYYADYVINPKIKSDIRILLRYKDVYYNLYGDMDIDTMDEKNYSYVEYKSRFLINRNIIVYYNNQLGASFNLAIIFYILMTTAMLVIIMWMHITIKRGMLKNV